MRKKSEYEVVVEMKVQLRIKTSAYSIEEAQDNIDNDRDKMTDEQFLEEYSSDAEIEEFEHWDVIPLDEPW